MTESSQTLLRYHGRSMWPYFQDGDLLTYLPVAPDRVKIGDCIVYRNRDGQLVTHRVVATQQGWVTRGDALKTPDVEKVAPGQLLGRVAVRYRFGHPVAVYGGLRGRLAGRVYHYAGRIDPQRETRGGRLARALRGVLATGLHWTGRCGSAHCLTRPGEPDLWLWKMGMFYVGRKNLPSAQWHLAWPWSLLVEIRENRD